MTDPDVRFDARVDRSGGPDACWPWTGGVYSTGYGYFYAHGRQGRAHRYAYARVHGDPGPDMVIDHECHNRSGCTITGPDCPHRRCCNPAHLAPKTSDQNVKASPNAHWRKTHCPRNHEYTPENTRLQPSRVPGNAPMRKCIECQRDKQREAYRARTGSPGRPGVGRPRGRTNAA